MSVNENKLDRVVELGDRKTVEQMCSITYVTDEYTINPAQTIIADPLHSQWSEYASGQR